MSNQEENENDRMEALASFTKDIGNRIFQGSEKTESLSSACIYRVPQDLRTLNESAYTPRLIAIGPFHWDDPHLKTMQHVKMYYANYLFFRLTKGIEDEGKRNEKKFELLQQCVERMEQLVDRAKKCYAEEVKVKHDDQMAEMMLVDGCFILELLCCYHDIKTKEAGKSTTNGGDSGNSKASSSGKGEQPMADPIFDNVWTSNMVKQDLLLLENQIPFFVLEELFKLTVAQNSGEKKLTPLTEYIFSYFSNILCPEGENSGGKMKTSCSSPSDCVLSVQNEVTSGCTKENENGNKVPGKTNDYHHILHVLHGKYRPHENKQCSENKENSTKFAALNVSASALDYAGVKFVPGKGKNLFDVKFNEHKGISWWCDRATFEIPTLSVHEPTEPFLRNLIAMEQCCPWVPLYFTSYAKLMDLLINSEKDVEVLTKANVIHNYLSENKDISDLFNNLSKEVVIGEFFFKTVCQDASNYSRLCWPQFMAYLRRRYFSSPWAFIGFCLALIVFAIQITQFGRSFHK